MSGAGKNRRRAGAGGGEESPTPAVVSRSVAPTSDPTAGPKAPGRIRRGARSMLRMLQVLFGVVVVIAASGGVAWGTREYVMTSPRFAVRTVAVDGQTRLSPEEVAKAGGVNIGDNVFALDVDLAAEAIEQHPWVASATVVRKLPGTVLIHVAEHEAHALTVIDGDVFLATRDGELFKELELGDPSDLPTVTGIEAERVAKDREGVMLSVKRALDINDELEELGVAEHYPVQEVHFEKDGAVVVTLGRDAIAVHLGQPPYRAKIEQAKRVLYEVRRRKAKPAVLFLDNDANPERVVVRLR